MSSQTPTLTILPQEILDTVFTNPALDYHDLLSLRLASPIFAKSIPFTNMKASRALAKTMLLQQEEAEYLAWMCDPRRPANPPFSFCYACLLRKPSSEFAATQRTKSRGLMKDEHARRFCTDCGWRKGIWEKGSMRLRGRNTILICRGCGGLSVGSLDALCRRYRVCGIKCWADVVREGREGGQDEGPVLDPPSTCVDGIKGSSKGVLDRVEEASMSSKVCAHAGLLTLMSTTQPRRQTKCLKCWTIDHTASPRPEGSRLCQSCESSMRASSR
jgi:hypothetical protein